MQHPYDSGYEAGKAAGIAEERARNTDRILALRNPVTMSIVITARDDGYTEYHCSWCSLTWQEQFVNGVALERPHPKNGCLWADAASSGSEETPHWSR